jgi:hypothetical protein
MVINQVTALSGAQRLAELEVENQEITAGIDQLTRNRRQQPSCPQSARSWFHQRREEAAVRLVFSAERCPSVASTGNVQSRHSLQPVENSLGIADER